MGDLSAIEGWPVEEVAAAAVLPSGAVLRHGRTDAVFPLASVTKPLVALAVLVAVEEGSVELDEPAGPVGSTVRHLLAHASGLGPEDDDVLAEPGTRRIYSNRGYEILGELLEARTELAVADYLHEAVLAPLGATGTRLEGSPAHGATGTVDDLVGLAADLLAPDPRILAAATRDLAANPAWPELAGVLPGFGRQDPNPWGLGVEIRGAKHPHWTPEGASTRTFGHFGRSGTLMWIDPDHGAALVVLGDREFGDWAPPLWRDLGATVLDLAAADERATSSS